MIIYFNFFFKPSLKKITYILTVSTFVCLYTFNIYQNFSKNYNDYSMVVNRTEFQKITNLIKENHKLSNITLLSFDSDIMIWAILNDIKYLNLVNALFTPKKDSMIENDLIKTFKFLNLDLIDFTNFFKNKYQKWRYVNFDVSTFFFYKYQANSLVTFNNSRNFDKKIMDHISKSSPILHQQSIIPNDELERLKYKFSILSLDNFNNPDIIILNKNEFFKNIEINKDQYCNKYDGEKFTLFFNKKKFNKNEFCS